MKEGLVFGDLGAPELIVILVIVLLLFGPGRIGKAAGELGRGIRNFHEGWSGKDEASDYQETHPPEEDNK